MEETEENKKKKKRRRKKHYIKKNACCTKHKNFQAKFNRYMIKHKTGILGQHAYSHLPKVRNFFFSQNAKHNSAVSSP